MLEGLSATLNNFANATQGISASVSSVVTSTHAIQNALTGNQPVIATGTPTTPSTATGFDITSFIKSNMTMIYILIGAIVVILIASKLFARAG